MLGVCLGFLVKSNTQNSHNTQLVVITMWFEPSNMKMVTALHSSDDIVSICLRREAGCAISRLHLELFGNVKSVFLALLLFPT